MRARLMITMSGRSARGKGGVHGLGVGAERADQGPGPVDAGLVQRVVARGVPEHVRHGDPLQLGRVAVDHHDLVAGVDQLQGGGAADPAVPADDHVVAQVRDVPVHAAPPEVLAQVALGHGLDEHAEVVEHGAHAEDDEHHGEDLTGVVERLHLAEADRRDHGDRLVERVERAEAEHDVADRAEDGDDEQGDDGDGDPPDRVATGVGAHEQRPAMAARARRGHVLILSPARARHLTFRG